MRFLTFANLGHDTLQKKGKETTTNEKLGNDCWYNVLCRNATPTYIIWEGLEIPTLFTHRLRRFVNRVGISRPSRMMYVGIVHSLIESVLLLITFRGGKSFPATESLLTVWDWFQSHTVSVVCICFGNPGSKSRMAPKNRKSYLENRKNYEFLNAIFGIRHRTTWEGGRRFGNP